MGASEVPFHHFENIPVVARIIPPKRVGMIKSFVFLNHLFK